MWIIDLCDHALLALLCNVSIQFVCIFLASSAFEKGSDWNGHSNMTEWSPVTLLWLSGHYAVTGRVTLLWLSGHYAVTEGVTLLRLSGHYAMTGGVSLLWLSGHYAVTGGVTLLWLSGHYSINTVVTLLYDCSMCTDSVILYPTLNSYVQLKPRINLLYIRKKFLYLNNEDTSYISIQKCIHNWTNLNPVIRNATSLNIFKSAYLKSHLNH